MAGKLWVSKDKSGGYRFRFKAGIRHMFSVLPRGTQFPLTAPGQIGVDTARCKAGSRNTGPREPRFPARHEGDAGLRFPPCPVSTSG